MVFLSICTALYDYSPRANGELTIQAGDVVYILEKSTEDAWWKAKKKATNENEDEPVGLIPNNYVAEISPIHNAKALYDYSRQTEEELSFSEDDPLAVFDTSDPDWTLVGLNGEFGFAPANYIEVIRNINQPLPHQEFTSPYLPAELVQEENFEDDHSSTRSPAPAANLVDVVGKQAKTGKGTESSILPRNQEDYSPTPILPQRPAPREISTTKSRDASPQEIDRGGIMTSPPSDRATRDQSSATSPSPGGYHLYNVNEMVSVMGKQKKMPTTLGINLATGVILIMPEKKRDGPQQDWTAEKLVHYSIEGKHVFLELVRPSRSIDFHAGARDTADEIVASLGELAGAARAEGLREVIAAGTGNSKQGRMLYDFMAQGDDEVTVADGDEVVILDDALSEEWWKVRRVKSGKEGVVPSSYVEITRPSTSPDHGLTPQNPGAGRSTVEQNRLDEERLSRESMQESLKSAKMQEEQALAKTREVGPGLKLPNRGSSLVAGQLESGASSQRSKRDSRVDSRPQSSKPSKAICAVPYGSTINMITEPESSKLRIWTDRSGSFKVEAQFIGLRDGKIHLHKTNGVKIAVPVVKMATSDLEFVERETGRSLDEDKPLSDLVKSSSKNLNGNVFKVESGPSQAIRPEYDWFDFFLKCGVNPHQCERYSSNFNRDSMDEGILPDITPTVLRNLGLKEGDILRVMKHLDTTFDRNGGKQKLRNVSFGGEEVIGHENSGNGDSGSPAKLFSGSGGTLRNTRKGRPAPAVQTNDTVDAKALRKPITRTDESKQLSRPRSNSPDIPGPVPPLKDNVGFDDDAWDLKPIHAPKASQPSSQVSAPSEILPGLTSSPIPSTLSSGMADLTLLSQPLKPDITHSTSAPTLPQSQLSGISLVQHPHQNQSLLNPKTLQGANTQFFSQLSPPQHEAYPITQQQITSNQISSQPASQSPSQVEVSSGPRQRPQPPHISQPSGLMPPPPTRPLSAPQNNASQNNFGPPLLQPQLTGVLGTSILHNQNLSEPQAFKEMSQSGYQQPGQFSQPQQQGMTGVQPQFVPIGQFGPSFSPHQTNFNTTAQVNSHVTELPPARMGTGSQQFGNTFPTAALQTQPTNYSQTFAANGPGPVSNVSNSINSMLPPALQPQQTAGTNFSGQGMREPIATGLAHQFSQQTPPLPQSMSQAAHQSLQPQKTGPAPAVKFGVVPETKRLVAQPTGRRANLAQASK